jgi:predicted transcriptional regulator of viral defense system
MNEAEANVDYALRTFVSMFRTAYHDGYWEKGKELWEQQELDFHDFWEYLTRPVNADAIRARIATVSAADWKHWPEEAYRQSVERRQGTPRKRS